MAQTTSKSDQIRGLLKTGMSPADIAKRVGCSRNLVYVVKAGRTDKGSTATRAAAPQQKVSRPSTSFDGLGDILAAVRGVEKERNEMRAVLEKLQGILSSALDA